jgi:hypothetical protein
MTERETRMRTRLSSVDGALGALTVMGLVLGAARPALAAVPKVRTPPPSEIATLDPYKPDCLGGATCDTQGHPAAPDVSSFDTSCKVMVSAVAWIPFPAIPQLAPGSKYDGFAGDDHHDPDINGGFRIRQDVMIDLSYPTKVYNKNLAMQTWGWYKDGGGTLQNPTYSHDKDFTNMDDMSAVALDVPDGAAAQIELKASATDPLIYLGKTLTPAITWDYVITFYTNKTDDGSNSCQHLSWTISGSHRKFPSYAIFVDNQLTDQYLTDDHGSTKDSSWSPLKIALSTSVDDNSKGSEDRTGKAPNKATGPMSCETDMDCGGDG